MFFYIYEIWDIYERTRRFPDDDLNVFSARRKEVSVGRKCDMIDLNWTTLFCDDFLPKSYKVYPWIGQA